MQSERNLLAVQRDRHGIVADLLEIGKRRLDRCTGKSAAKQILDRRSRSGFHVHDRFLDRQHGILGSRRTVLELHQNRNIVIADLGIGDLQIPRIAHQHAGSLIQERIRRREICACPHRNIIRHIVRTGRQNGLPELAAVNRCGNQRDDNSQKNHQPGKEIAPLLRVLSGCSRIRLLKMLVSSLHLIRLSLRISGDFLIESYILLYRFFLRLSSFFAGFRRFRPNIINSCT